MKNTTLVYKCWRKKCEFLTKINWINQRYSKKKAYHFLENLQVSWNKCFRAWMPFGYPVSIIISSDINFRVILLKYASKSQLCIETVKREIWSVTSKTSIAGYTNFLTPNWMCKHFLLTSGIQLTDLHFWQVYILISWKRIHFSHWNHRVTLYDFSISWSGPHMEEHTWIHKHTHTYCICCAG